MTAGMMALVAVLDPRPGNETHVASWIYAAAGGATAATIVALVLASFRGGSMWRRPAWARRPARASA